MTPKPCTHPPARQFAWIAYDGTLCVGCCQCGKVLAGEAHKELSKTQQQLAWLTDYAKRRLSPPQLDEYLRYLASPSNVTPLAAVGWRDVTLDWLEIAREEGELTL